jgi:hypothetical protein
LGGATLNNSGEWQGKWTMLPSDGGKLTIPVSAASAVIARIGLPGK